ncbi:hypothetical protein D6S13_10965 [Salmonella enterica subsp. enterica]|nr:hypothetical protein [Salmonella enterica subsp. enterica]
MKAGICLFIENLSFEEDNLDILTKILRLQEFVSKVCSDFKKFFRSNTFDQKFIEFIMSTSSDHGGLMNEFYKIKSEVLDLNCENLQLLINNTPPIHLGRLLSVYKDPLCTSPISGTTGFIENEEDLILFCKGILENHPTSSEEYASAIQEVFKNIIFLDNPPYTFNAIDKMEGGYVNFLKGITEFLYFVNGYKIIPNDSLNNINAMKASLIYPVTPEGGGKNRRSIGELKRDFKVKGVIYKNINCEFHYKLEYEDGCNKTGTYRFNRIYFGFFNKIPTEDPKIAIAHIGDHL